MAARRVWRVSSSGPESATTCSATTVAGAGATACSESAREGLGGLEPLGRSARERRGDHRVEGGRAVGHERRRRGDGRLHHPAHLVELVVAAEQALRGERLPEDDARGEHVASPVDCLSVDLLGRHVRALALDDAGPRAREAARGLGDAKVDDATDSVDPDDDVLRADVTMDDPERLAPEIDRLVGFVQAGQGVGDDARDDGGVELLAALRGRAEQRRERDRLDVFHDEHDLVVGPHDVDDGHDVRVPDARREARLVEQHGRELTVFRQLPVHTFDHDEPLEPRRAAVHGDPHGRRPTRRELDEELVVPDALPGGERRAHLALSKATGRPTRAWTHASRVVDHGGSRAPSPRPRGDRMFESAELGHKVAKAAYDRRVPALRYALLEAQLKGARQGRVPRRVRARGRRRERPGRGRQSAARMDGPAARARSRERRARRRRARPAPDVALLARAPSEGKDVAVLRWVVRPAHRRSRGRADRQRGVRAPARRGLAVRAHAGRRGRPGRQALAPPHEEGPGAPLREAGEESRDGVARHQRRLEGASPLRPRACRHRAGAPRDEQRRGPVDGRRRHRRTLSQPDRRRRAARRDERARQERPEGRLLCARPRNQRRPSTGAT